MNKALFSLLLLSLFAAGCNTSGRLRDDDDDDDDATDDEDGVTDDDDATGDDDDSTGDDDDATGDDDDATGDDDDATGDDDDSTGDDDDSTPIGLPPDDPTGMEDETYCLDWTTVNVIQPPGLVTLLSTVAGVQIEDYPLLLSPTDVNIANSTIDMLLTGAQQSTCIQDMTIPTVDLSATQPGAYVPPEFVVGPANFNTTIDSFALNIFEMELSGQFSQDHQQITQGFISGAIDITAYSSTACFLLACYPCPGNPNLECVTLEADQAVFNITANGPLLPVQ